MTITARKMQKYGGRGGVGLRGLCGRFFGFSLVHCALIMKLFLAISAALTVLSTHVECFVSTGLSPLAPGAQSNVIAASSAFVQPKSRYQRCRFCNIRGAPEDQCC